MLQMVPLSMTVSDLRLGFQGHNIVEVEYLKNGTSKGPNIWNATTFGDL